MELATEVGRLMEDILIKSLPLPLMSFHRFTLPLLSFTTPASPLTQHNRPDEGTQLVTTVALQLSLTDGMLANAGPAIPLQLPTNGLVFTLIAAPAVIVGTVVSVFTVTDCSTAPHKEFDTLA